LLEVATAGFFSKTYFLYSLKADMAL